MFVLALLSASGAVSAWAGTPLTSVSPPALPAPRGPAPLASSFIDLSIALPIASLRAGLERALPGKLRGDSQVDTAIADALDAEHEPGEQEKEGETEREWTGRPVRWRGLLQREPFRVVAHADSLVVTAGLSWSVELLERGLETSRCGSAKEPLTGSIGCASLLGWSDDWSLETRSRMLPARFSRGCRLSPPGLEFTHRVNARVEQRLTSLLPARVDSVVRAATDQSASIRAALRLLAMPVMIGDSAAWLQWDVRAARVDPPRGAGDSILTHVVFEVSPSIEPRPEPRAGTPLPVPLVRLSGRGIRVPFDCWVEFADIARDVASLPAGPTDRESGALRVTSARVTGGGDRLAIALDLDGPVTGTAWLVGRLSVMSPRFLLGCPDLDWSAESRHALERAAGTGRWPALRATLTSVRDAVRRRLERPLGDCVSTWDKSIRDAMQPTATLPTLEGGISAREVAEVFCTDHAIGVRLIALGQARLISEREPSPRQ